MLRVPLCSQGRVPLGQRPRLFILLVQNDLSPRLLGQSWFMRVSRLITASTALPPFILKCHLVEEVYGHAVDK